MFPKPAKGTALKQRKAAKRLSQKQAYDALWVLHGMWAVSDGRMVQRGICHYCFKLVTRGQDGEVNHIRPRSTHPELKYALRNLEIVCHDCNQTHKAHPADRRVAPRTPDVPGREAV